MIPQIKVTVPCGIVTFFIIFNHGKFWKKNMQKISERLTTVAQPMLQAIIKHLFLQDVVSGTISKEAIVAYVQQDEYYLGEYAKCFANAYTLATDSEEQAAIIPSIAADSEVIAHEWLLEYAGTTLAKVGLSKPSPNTIAYLNYLKVSGQHSYLYQITALPPCLWIYHEFGKALAPQMDITTILGKWMYVYNDLPEIFEMTLANDLGPIVIDPVMVAKGGAKLLTDNAINAVKEKLLPLATLVTPNLLEAEQLTGISINGFDELELAAKALQDLGAKNVLIKGGHGGDELTDYILLADGSSFTLVNPHLDTVRTHGTGDTYAAAIASQLALGADLTTAIKTAKDYLFATVADEIIVGYGHGPLNHWAKVGTDNEL